MLLLQRSYLMDVAATLARVPSRWALTPRTEPPARLSAADSGAVRRELARLFLEDAPTRVAQLEAAVRDQDRRDSVGPRISLKGDCGDCRGRGRGPLRRRA